MWQAVPAPRWANFCQQENIIQKLLFISFKVTVDVPLDGEVDQEVLRNVHATAARSKFLVGELHHLKAKIYSLENDLRHCG